MTSNHFNNNMNDAAPTSESHHSGLAAAAPPPTDTTTTMTTGQPPSGGHISFSQQGETAADATTIGTFLVPTAAMIVPAGTASTLVTEVQRGCQALAYGMIAMQSCWIRRKTGAGLRSWKRAGL
jgi:hypothetical protein